MASKRVVKTSIEWQKLQKLLPNEQQAVYSNLLAKNYQYSSKVASLPENLPKIDFDAYKKQLPNPSAIEKLEKGYLAFQASYPKDTENLISKIDKVEKEENTRLAEILKQVVKKVESLKAEKHKLENIPPLEEWTKELEVYYFPERTPTYKEIVEAEDPYQKMIDDRKKGKHH